MDRSEEFATSYDTEFYVGKEKLSQNHPKERVERVISELSKLDKPDEQAIAKWMKNKSLSIE